jgi:prolyl oligopeptidase
MREAISGNDILLVDPEKIDPSGLTSIAWTSPSHDGRYLAYGLYNSGDENSRLQIIDTDNLVLLADEIANKVGGVCWLPDNTGFIHSRLADPMNPYSREIRFHRIGDSQANDRLVFSQYTEGPLATTWGPFAHLSACGKWLILGYHTSTRSNDLWLADFSSWLAGEELRLKPIITGSDSTTHAHVAGDKLYIYSNENAPNGQIFVASAGNPEKSAWNCIVAEKERAVIDEWGLTADSILVCYQQNACSELVLIDRNTYVHRKIAFSGPGSAAISTDEHHHDFFYRFESFNAVPAIYHADNATEVADMWWKTDIDADLSAVEVAQYWFASKDQTPVSMFVVARKGLTKDGRNPCMVYGYGGFAISMTPTFSGPVIPWVEDGGIYVVVNLRGGGEYGDNWHKSGTLRNKKKVFEDFEAAIEFLVSEKFSSPEHIIISGRSNGGLLTGAVMTRRPELMQAAIIGVPLLDMLRYQHFLMAKYWVPEYGASEDSEAYDWLVEYSPYHNIWKNRKYPAAFVFTGENDTRVHPMHARKMVAALQTYGENSAGQPVLLWVDRDSGHGQGKPLNLVVEELTDQWLFARWQTGMGNR